MVFASHQQKRFKKTIFLPHLHSLPEKENRQKKLGRE
jgi:hypothetical protein